MLEWCRTCVRPVRLVSCAVGVREEFKVEVGLHQGSALSTFLFALVMGRLTDEVIQESPWTMMFADDIVICRKSREQVEENLEGWRSALENRGMKNIPVCDEKMRINEVENRGREEEKDHDEDERSRDEGFMGMTPLLQAHHAMEKMEEFVHKVWEGRWRVIPHDVLPDWLKDNEFLLYGHRPPMPSFRACFKSIFRIHTETGNIWTHLLGCLFFLCLGLMYMFRPNMSFVAPVQEKVVIGMFFLGAILCLSFSWLFHTVYCHSEGVSRVFSKLDYSGIAFLIMGSFVPWLYYSFYCSPQPCVVYLIVVCILGLAAITVSQCDFFATPQYRGVRAGVFVGLGLSGVVPSLHFVISEGLIKATTMGQMGWLLLMATLYITGACLYAARIPERFFPGKCDIWFHSHQLFHILVVAGAFVHFHGVSNLQEFRYTAGGGCTEDGNL
ncbi:adiponectin receptor protein 2 isoform X1 [Channa argus]|uniref:adiponectin receptor protein 2 isoform X1 n=1 Tax=Channa argus TaxID=215402 RepID=UPI0035223537